MVYMPEPEFKGGRVSGLEDISTATIKFGTGFDAPWFVAYGNVSTQRRQLVEAFGIDDPTELSLIELMAKLSVDARAVFTLANSGATQSQSAGRKVTTRRAPAKAAAAPKAEAPAAEAATSAERAPAEDEAPQHPAFAKIEAATTLLELKAAWAAHMDDFKTNTELQAAYKAKRAEVN